MYKQDPSKLAEDDLIKHLDDLSRPEKVSKWVSIPGTLQLILEVYDSKEKLQGMVEAEQIMTFK